MEYCFHKRSRKWEDTGKVKDGENGISYLKLRSLKNSKTRASEFIKTRRIYPNCRYGDVKLMYHDIDDFAFFLGEKIVLYYETECCKTTNIFKPENIVAYKKLRNILKDKEKPDLARKFIINQYRDLYFSSTRNFIINEYQDLYKNLSNDLSLFSDNVRLYLEINPIKEDEIYY